MKRFWLKLPARPIPKIMSLFGAILLYFYVQNLKVKEITVNIPVAFVNKPPNLALVGEVPRYVSLVIAGREEALKFSTANLRAEVNLLEAEIGRASYPVDFDTRQLPENVKLRKGPPQVNLTFERIIRKKVPIIIRTTGSPEPGFRLVKIQYSPEIIWVEGAESLIKNLKEISTAPLSLEGISQNTFRRLRIQSLPQIQTEVSEIEVKVSVGPSQMLFERQFDSVPIRAVNLDPALHADFSDKFVRVLVSGDRETIKKITISDLSATVDLAETRYNPRTGSILPYEIEQGIPIKVKLLRFSKELSIVNFSPENISVRFSVKEEYKPKEEVNP